jgi:ParB/Sulfiredoxin domain
LTDAPQSAGLVALAERIELWPIERLRPYERNPRTHSEAQVDQLAASMVEFGWTNPILIDENAGIRLGLGLESQAFAGAVGGDGVEGEDLGHGRSCSRLERGRLAGGVRS